MTRRRRSLLPPDEARKRYVRAAEGVILRQIQSDGRPPRPGRRRSERRGWALCEAQRRGGGCERRRQESRRDHEPVQESAAIPVAGHGARPRGPGGRCQGPAGSCRVRGRERLDRWAGDRGIGARPASLHGADARIWAELGVVAQPGAIRRLERTDRRAEHARVPTSADQLATFGILPALARFSLEVRPPWDVNDVATAMASAREGVWLNQALTGDHPTRQEAPTVDAMRNALRMVWDGATRPSTR